MVWRDACGMQIEKDDIVEDTEKRFIGKVLYRYGKPYIRYFKRFSYQTLGYEFVSLTGPDDAYIRCLATKKEWLYRLNGHRLNHVEVLQKRKPMERNAQTVTPVDMPPWEAPAPADWW